MQHTVAHQAFKLSDRNTSGSTGVSRVATMWLRSNMVLEYDRMIRLQYLEGVAHKPLGTWWKHGLQGMQQAMKFFSDSAVQSVWFDAGNSGMLGIIRQRVMAMVARSPAINGTDPYDIINSVLMGIPVDPTKEKLRDIPTYTAGKLLSEKTLRGEETPETVASGNLSKMFQRRVIDLSKSRQHETQLPTDDEGNVRDIQDHDKADVPAWHVLGALFFTDTDPFAKKVQGLMESMWESSPAMTAWLETVRLTGDYPDGASIATQVGITKQTYSQKHWIPRWDKFLRALLSNPYSRNEIIQRVQDAGSDDSVTEAIEEFMSRTDRPGKVATMVRMRTAMLRMCTGL